ncbi:MAG: hypothetical protein ABDH66_07875 [Bacteroidia bacterium]
MRYLLIISIGLTMCSSPSSTTPSAENMKATKSIAIPIEQLALPYCPECEMRFTQFPIADTLTYDNKIYGFCSEGCKKAFSKRMGI